MMPPMPSASPILGSVCSGLKSPDATAYRTSCRCVTGPLTRVGMASPTCTSSKYSFVGIWALVVMYASPLMCGCQSLPRNCNLAGIQHRYTVLVGIADLDGEDIHRLA